MRFQSKDIQYFISYNVWPCFVLSGCEYHIWYSHPINFSKHNRKRKYKPRADKQNGYQGGMNLDFGSVQTLKSGQHVNLDNA